MGEIVQIENLDGLSERSDKEFMHTIFSPD